MTTGEEQPIQAKSLPYQVLGFIAAFLVTAFLWSAALSLVITLLWKGIPILKNGIPMCQVLFELNRPDLILRSSCGCALVELIAFPIGLLGVIILSPRLFRLFAAVRAFRREDGPGKKPPAP